MLKHRQEKILMGERPGQALAMQNAGHLLKQYMEISKSIGISESTANKEHSLKHIAIKDQSLDLKLKDIEILNHEQEVQAIKNLHK